MQLYQTHLTRCCWVERKYLCLVVFSTHFCSANSIVALRGVCCVVRTAQRCHRTSACQTVQVMVHMQMRTLWYSTTACYCNLPFFYVENAFHSTESQFLVISPTMTSKTCHMSILPWGVNIFKTLRLQDCWADVDETSHPYSMALGTQLLGSRILNFWPLRHSDPKLSWVGRADHSQVGCLIGYLVLCS